MRFFDREIRAKKTHSLEHTRANNYKGKTNVQDMETQSGQIQGDKVGSEATAMLINWLTTPGTKGPQFSPRGPHGAGSSCSRPQHTSPQIYFLRDTIWGKQQGEI